MSGRDSTPQRLLVVFNRLPFTVAQHNGDIGLKPSSGGLVTGLGAYLESFKAKSGEDPNYL